MCHTSTYKDKVLERYEERVLDAIIEVGKAWEYYINSNCRYRKGVDICQRILDNAVYELNDVDQCMR
jgi:hypothetical protein